MNPVALRREIADVKRQRGELDTQRAGHAEAIDLELGAEHCNMTTVRERRSALDWTTDRIAELNARVEALERQLPTKAAIARAAAECVRLEQAAGERAVAFDTAAKAFATAMAAAEQAGRHLAAARAGARDALATWIDTATAAGLDAPAFEPPELSERAATVAQLQAVLLGEVAFGDAEHVTVINLNAARAA